MALWYKGPIGLDPRTHTTTHIQLCATLSLPNSIEWIVPEILLTHIYQSVRSRIQQSNGTYRVYEPQIGKPIAVKQYLYIDGDCSGCNLAGPFSLTSLTVFLGNQFRETSAWHHDLRIYRIPTTPKVLKTILCSPWSETQEFPAVIEPAYDLF